MEKQLLKLLEEAKKDKNKLKDLKVLAVKCQLFSLAADIRDLERQIFPESEETKNAKIDGAQLSTLFRTLDMNIGDRYAWLINESIKKYDKRKGNFDMKDAAALKAKMIEHFGEE